MQIRQVATCAPFDEELVKTHSPPYSTHPTRREYRGKLPYVNDNSSEIMTAYADCDITHSQRNK